MKHTSDSRRVCHLPHALGAYFLLMLSLSCFAEWCPADEETESVLSPVDALRMMELTRDSMNPLAEMQSVTIDVHVLSPKDLAAFSWLKKSVIQNWMEIRLRQKGVPVGQHLDLIKASELNTGRAAIVVNCEASAGGRWVCHLELRITQMVMIPKTKRLTFATTREYLELATGENPIEARPQIEAAVDAVMDEFIADFLKANPKTQEEDRGR